VIRFARRRLLALATLVAPAALAGEKRILYIQPLGKALPESDVAFVRRALLAFYALDVRMLARSELPRSAHYPKRARYRAEKLLDFLVGRMPNDGYRVLGLTGVDISTTKGKIQDWGILGLATLDGAACVLSSFRTKRKAKNVLHARIRLGKTAVHEIGHTFGLPHCPNKGCLMEDGRGSVLTTDREYDLCAGCRTRLIRAGHQLSDSNDMPWPKPEAS
jgi:archaemetzincin